MRLVDVVLLTLVLAGALAWPLVAPPIAAHGEAREGLVVQDVALRGEWTLPRRNGELPSKPPLFHWIAAAATRVFGFTDAAVRARRRSPRGWRCWRPSPSASRSAVA